MKKNPYLIKEEKQKTNLYENAKTKNKQKQKLN